MTIGEFDMMDPASRRTLLKLMGAGAGGVVAASDVRARSSDSPPTAADAVVGTVAMLADLAHRPGVTGATWLVGEEGRTGLWSWRDVNLSERIAADPLHGLYLRHATIPSGLGAWVRDWDGCTGRPEWFGARVDAADFDNTPALQAALDLCPKVRLGSGSYFTRRTLRITRNGSCVVGAGYTQTDQGANGSSTQIVCTSPTETILQIGAANATQPGTLIECVQVRDLTVRRSVAPFIPAAGFAGAIGIALRWCVNCRMERVFSIDSAIGWSFYGTIENYVVGCSALRGRQGSNPAADFFIGFHLDYTAPLAANGGNASLYFHHCRAFAGFGEGRPALVYSAGLRTDGGWVDLYIDALETGTIHYGIDGHGDAFGSGASFRTEDLMITNCVLDPGDLAAIRLQTADSSSAVQITNNYFATNPNGTAIMLRDLAGSIALTANQCVIGDVGGGGLWAVNVNNLRCANNIYTKLQKPVRLERVTNFHVQDTANALDVPNAAPGITLIDCTRGKVDCIVSGRPGAYSAGVHLEGTGNALVEVQCTGLQASAFRGGASAKLIDGSRPVTRAGPFGNDCLANGIMT